MKKILIMALALVMSVGAMTGCGKQQGDKGSGSSQSAATDRKTMELQQNDYRGGITRMKAVQENILEVMETMKSNNVILREDSPYSFWGTEGYQDFVATFLDTPIVDDTCWFNEEEGDWETTLKMMSSVKNSFTVPNDNNGFTLKAIVTRNEKDDYTVSGITDTFYPDPDGKKKYEGARVWRVLYDCDKDWCKAYCTQTIDPALPDVTVQMLEYMRINDDTFVVQTSRERLMVILNPVEKDTDLREREVKEFYYSKLVQEGMRTTFKPFMALPEVDEATETELKENIKANELMAQYPSINVDGDLSTFYGQHDSVFFRSPANITPSNFVFEDKSLQQAICYKDGVLVVTTFNKLSEAYERFTYSLKDADAKIATELEKLVEINNLVGIQELPDGKAEVTNKKDKDKESEEKTTKPTEETSEEATTENAPESTEPTSETDPAAVTTEQTTEKE